MSSTHCSVREGLFRLIEARRTYDEHAEGAELDRYCLLRHSSSRD